MRAGNPIRGLQSPHGDTADGVSNHTSQQKRVDAICDSSCHSERRVHRGQRPAEAPRNARHRHSSRSRETPDRSPSESLRFAHLHRRSEPKGMTRWAALVRRGRLQGKSQFPRRPLTSDLSMPRACSSLNRHASSLRTSRWERGIPSRFGYLQEPLLPIVSTRVPQRPDSTWRGQHDHHKQTDTPSNEDSESYAHNPTASHHAPSLATESVARPYYT